MLCSLKFILSKQLKGSDINQPENGFTLIELLVAIIIAFLVITPLMTFMIGVMDNDRKEQAKVTSEQEIQTAIDYINRDLQQAVYIYDKNGLTQNNNPTTVSSSGIKDQIPPASGATATSCTDTAVCTPVLVFWKRNFLPNSVGITASTQTAANSTDDSFVYSLVGYYLITNSGSTWSSQARIGRFEIKSKPSSAYANSNFSTDTGFKNPPINDPSITGSTLQEKMNQWKNSLTAGGTYNQPVDALVDYISTTGPAIDSTNCTGTVGFYACVDAAKVTALVVIRGNALARLQNNNLAYNSNVKTYFPAVNIQTQGRGFLYVK